MSFDVLLRGLTIILYLAREAYWKVIEQNADNEKPKVSFLSSKGRIERIIYRGMWVFLGLQLVGFKVLPYSHNSSLQLVGFGLVVVSVIISILARHELGASWAHAAEYQVKQKQELVTTGIYRYVRHPIYLGLLLSFVGGEIVAESYLAIPFLFILLAGAYIQGKREENILLNHFGNKYKNYIQKSKMLFPYVL